MKIDNYIRHLELQRKGLREKYNDIQNSKTQFIKGTDVSYEELQSIRNKHRDTTNRLKFLLNLKKEIINSEIQDKEVKQR